MKKYKVYCLKNEFGDIKYVGQTRQSLERRFNEHKNSKRHPTNNFYIELIAEFDELSQMYDLETRLIDELDLVNTGWNREYGKTKVPKQFDGSGKNNGFYKHSHRQEIREKIGKRSLGNSYAKGSKSRRGLKSSEEHKLKISLKRKKPVYLAKLDIVFFSAKDAAKFLKLHESKVAAVCRGDRRHTRNYIFSWYLKDS